MEYAIDAFEVPAFRYVSRSSLDKKLFTAINEAIKQLQRNSGRAYSFRFKNCLYKLFHKDITFVRKEGKNTVFSTTDKAEYFVRKSLAAVFSELASDEFMFINKSCVVNINHIISVHAYEILLVNGERLYISRSNLNQVKRIIAQFWGNEPRA